MTGRPKTKNRKIVAINLDEDIKTMAKIHGVKNFSDWINSISRAALLGNSIEELEEKKKEYEHKIRAIEKQITMLQEMQIADAARNMEIETAKRNLIDWAVRRLDAGYKINKAWITGKVGKEYMDILGWTPKQTLEFLQKELEVQ